MPLRPAHLLLTAIALASMATFAPSAHAQNTPAAAQHFLEGRHQQVQRLLRQPASARRNSALSSVIEGLLDYDSLAKAALGSAWEEHTQAERQAFAELLKQLVQMNYQHNLENTLDFRVSYGEAEADGDVVIVHTEARSRTNRRAPSVSIDYRLHQVDGNWRVVDISTDGSSMVRSYHRQFRRIIRREGWDGLMTRMRARLDDAEPSAG
ncbi:MAG: ABC transporter substrate-binding protein [Deltaproteobacteria bacterium]|nr:ABC transporter substrate-binding protein [Deltaproteobacteria bacterium]